MMMMIFMPASQQTDSSVGKLLNAFHLWLLTTKIREGVIDEVDEADDDDDDDDDEIENERREDIDPLFSLSIKKQSISI
ncbi:MAG: hypothetical protein ACQPRI_06205 [Solitalea-like symbiont of Tyrophagus putrescentiae]